MERHARLAGITAALVGFTSTSAVVLSGLHAVGATTAQAASGLVALCLAQALGMLWLTQRYRMPITLAWSTPGAALLASGGAVEGGWAAAVGAFAAVGVLIVVTALWPTLGRLVAAIPAPVAQAMLAGVLATLCLAPVRALAEDPTRIAPVALVWLVLLRWAPRWAAPAAFAAALVIIGVDAARQGVDGPVLPALELTAPTLSWPALLGIALPLYVVTMASQNVPGVAVLASFGYRTPWRAAMTVTGLGTIAGAPAGGHVVNLAAITAALAASPEAHPDPAERWRAARTTAWAYLLIAALATALTTLVAAAPAGVLAAVAGLALVPTLGSSLAAALGDSAPGHREAAVVTFLVAASGVTVLGIGGAFWALVAGLAVLGVVGWSRSAREGTGEVNEASEPT